MVAELLTYVPPIKFLLQQKRVVKDDNTTDVFNLKSNLLINIEEESKAFAVNYNPIDVRGFADATFPKLKKHIDSSDSTRKRRNAESGRSLTALFLV